MQTSASTSSTSSGASPPSSSRRASCSQRERGASMTPTLTAAEMVGAGHGGDNFGLVGGLACEWPEAREFLDDDVPVALVALEASSGEKQGRAAPERPAALV